MHATHAIPGAKAMPPGCNSPAFKGITITWTLSPRRDLVLHSKIWVWNGPSLMFSFMKTGSSTNTVPHLLNKSEALAIAHEVDNLSNSLSFITLTILPSLQVPIMRGTCLENSDLSGTTRKMMSSSYLAISVTCTCKITKPRGRVLVLPSPIKLRG